MPANRRSLTLPPDAVKIVPWKFLLADALLKPRQGYWAAIILVGCLTALLYLPVARFGFVYDDVQYVTGNPAVAGGLSAASAGWAFTSRYAGNWHPITWLSLMADAGIFGLRPGLFHLVNLLLHVANSVLLLVFLRRATGALWSSALVALLFGIHPLHVESAAWITERKDLLSTLFGLLALLAYSAWTARGGWRRYLLLVAAFAASLMAKPMLVTLPFVLLLLDFWPLGRLPVAGPLPSGAHRTADTQTLGRVRRLVWEKIPLFTLAAASSVVTYYVQAREGAVQSLEYFALGARLKNAVLAYLGYLSRTVWPVGLSVVYQHRGENLPLAAAVAAALVLALVSVLVVLLGKKRPYAPVGWFWYLGTLVPVIGLVQVGVQAMADRYSYLPLVGIFLLAAWAGRDLLAAKPRAVPGAVALTAAAVICLGAVSHRQIAFWRDDVALFGRAVELNPDNWTALNNLAGALSLKDRKQEAAALYRKAFDLNPDFRALARFQAGEELFVKWQYQQAIDNYLEALQLKPEYPEAMVSLGLCYALTGRRDEASVWLEKLKKLGSPLAGDLEVYLR